MKSEEPAETYHAPLGRIEEPSIAIRPFGRETAEYDLYRAVCDGELIRDGFQRTPIGCLVTVTREAFQGALGGDEGAPVGGFGSEVGEQFLFEMLYTIFLRGAP